MTKSKRNFTQQFNYLINCRVYDQKSKEKKEKENFSIL